MSKEDFEMRIEELGRIGILRIATDHYMEPRRRGSNFFVKSPISSDRTWSCCLYPSNNRFCDFAGGNKSGDIIGFYAHIKNCNQWQALQILSAYYGLSSDRQRGKEEARKRIQRQQAEERKKAARKQAFHNALFGEIDRLKDWLNKYRLILEKGELEPFSDLWAYVMNEIQGAEYKLDILTAADMDEYRRMKSNPAQGLPSDRPQWILDCLAILAEVGVFEATEEEIKEITAQRDFELRRAPGRDRRCCVEW